MSKLAKLIFTADMIEDGRNYDGVERLRQIYYTKDLDTAFKECLKEEILHLEQKGYELFGETRNAYEYYIKKSF
jgi:HD superfamily phosphohydrolase YqeK